MRLLLFPGACGSSREITMPDEQDSNREPPADEPPESLRTLLVELEDPAPPELLLKVRRTIHRRTAAAQFSAFAWRTPGLIVAELVRLLGALPASFRSKPASSREDTNRWT